MSDIKYGSTEGGVDIDQLIQARRGDNYDQTIPGAYERYMNDVKKYLVSKLPDEREYILDEIAVYCTTRMIVAANDVIVARDVEWKRTIDLDLKRSKTRRREVEEAVL